MKKILGMIIVLLCSTLCFSQNANSEKMGSDSATAQQITIQTNVTFLGYAAAYIDNPTLIKKFSGLFKSGDSATKKVTLVLNPDQVISILSGLSKVPIAIGGGMNYQFIQELTPQIKNDSPLQRALSQLDQQYNKDFADLVNTGLQKLLYVNELLKDPN